ncbi:MAG: hypothetical protein CSA29_03075 [Desulfobacterales bacterium]|nr:MAG: hypothetical protein CSA29_03075 [Desulfobacterales bacterium]
MKIDTFDLGLSVSRTHTKSITRETSRKFSFTQIMQGIQAPNMGPGLTTNTETPYRQWFTPVSMNGQDALSMTTKFRQELENIRQIMDALMAYINSKIAGGGSLSRAGGVNLFLRPVSPKMVWEYTETHSVKFEESEHTQVSTNGTIRTADHRDIDFSFDLSMDRSYFREETMTCTQSGYTFIDPLIIQTGMAAPELAGATFNFDLTLDGNEETLPLPGAGTGFLALDRNGDGKINDGSELFGPSTGDGFGELATYDVDHNDWIDENDPIFDQLTLWEYAESSDAANEGEGDGMVLTRLKDAGIGAVYLSGVSSPFDLTDAHNEVQGRITQTSVALTESGNALPVHEMAYKV